MSFTVADVVLDLDELASTIATSYEEELHVERFQIKLSGVGTRATPLIQDAAHFFAPSLFPARGQAWPAAPDYGLYAKLFSWKPRTHDLLEWYCTVTYKPLAVGQPNLDGVADNPLMWPATYSLDWIEYEEAITQAKNGQPLGENTPTGERAVNTMGPLVNGALIEFSEAVLQNARDAVLCIHQNVATLDEVLELHGQYKKTTNVDTVFGVGPRRYKYLDTTSGGIQRANGVDYYLRTTRVQVTKTTDLIRNNVSFLYYYEENGVKRPGYVTVTDPVTKQTTIAADPQFISRKGSKLAASDGPDKTPTLTYYYLDPVPYQPLLVV